MMDGGGGGGGGVRSPPSWASILRKERRFSTEFNFSSSSHHLHHNQPNVFDIKQEEDINNCVISHENGGGGGGGEGDEEDKELSAAAALLLTHPKKNKGLRRLMTDDDGAFSNNSNAAIQQLGAINKIEDKVEPGVNNASSYNLHYQQLLHRRASFSSPREDHHHHHSRLQGPSVIVNGNGVLECRGNNVSNIINIISSNGSNSSSSGGCSRSSSTISVCSSNGGGGGGGSPLSSEDLSLSMLMRRSSPITTEESFLCAHNNTPGVQDLSLRSSSSRRTFQDDEEVEEMEFGLRCRDIRYLVEEEDDYVDNDLPQDLSVKKTEPKIYNNSSKVVVEDLSVKKRKFIPPPPQQPPPPLTYDFGMWSRRPHHISSYDFSNNKRGSGCLPVSISCLDYKINNENGISSSRHLPPSSYNGNSSIIEVKILPQQHHQYPSFNVKSVEGVRNGSRSNINGNVHVKNEASTDHGELMIIDEQTPSRSSRSVVQRRRSTGGLIEAAAAYSPVKEDPRPESVSSTSNSNNTTMNGYENNTITTTTPETESGGVIRRKRGRRRKDEVDSGEVVKTYDCFLCSFTATKEAVLMAHLNRMHTVKGNRGNVRCTVCAYSCPTIEELRAHQEQTHSSLGGSGTGGGDGGNAAGEEMKVAFHACHHCSKKFRSEGQRQAHLRLIAQKQVWKEMKAAPRNP